MPRPYKKQQEKTNYNFLLNCMVALTSVAVITAGTITALTLHSASVAATTALFTSAFVFAPLIPVALVAIGLICLLPTLFRCNDTLYTSNTFTTPVRYHHNSYGFYSSPPYANTHYHGNPSTGGPIYPPNSHTHGHISAERIHGHDAGNIHGHPSSGGGGFVHGHH